ncbi:universal stress protein [Streptomyces sp. NPDC046931]|uniref:universal stress protein n=1 Tax=Streptomyces sp. NPDC046931 TaxID=3154806 RepID=UPI0033C77B54
MGQVVTVGLDGSPESLAAAHWATDEAERRNLTLYLLHAWPLLAPEPTSLPCEVDQNYWAKRLVQDARAKLSPCHPSLTVVDSLVADDARHALLQAASESEMTVLGSRGLEPVESYFLGDISMPVVARCERPVVLVRADIREEGTPPAPSGRVMVKLHGSCDGLLAFAFATIAARNVALVAVHGRSVPLHAHLPWGVDHAVTEEITQDGLHQLSQALRPWHERFQRVEVIESIALESPAKAAVRAGEGAGVPVLGRRRHRPALAPHLGPVTQAAIHHARCAVAVVPHD